MACFGFRAAAAHPEATHGLYVLDWWLVATPDVAHSFANVRRVACSVATGVNRPCLPCSAAVAAMAAVAAAGMAMAAALGVAVPAAQSQEVVLAGGIAGSAGSCRQLRQTL